MSLQNKCISFTEHVAFTATVEGDLVPLAGALLVAHYDGRLPDHFYLPLTDAERNNPDGEMWIEKLRQQLTELDAGIIERAVAMDAIAGEQLQGMH